MPVSYVGRDPELTTEEAERAGIREPVGQFTVAVGANGRAQSMIASLAGLGVAFRAKPLVKQSAKQAISTLGLDGILYLLGFRDREGLE